MMNLTLHVSLLLWALARLQKHESRLKVSCVRGTIMKGKAQEPERENRLADASRSSLVSVLPCLFSYKNDATLPAGTPCMLMPGKSMARSLRTAHK